MLNQIKIKNLEIKEGNEGFSEIKIIGTPLIDENNEAQHDFELKSQKSIVKSNVNFTSYNGIRDGKIIIEIELYPDQSNNLLIMTPINE